MTILLDNDADVSIANNSSEIPLHATARSGNKEIIGKLIQYGANLDATDKEGRTPLICLLDNKRTDAALFLIEQGADTEITDNTGVSCGDEALKNILDTYGHLIGEERKLLSLASGAGDEATVALMSDYLKEQEKLVWMLVAYSTCDCKK